MCGLDHLSILMEVKVAAELIEFSASAPFFLSARDSFSGSSAVFPGLSRSLPVFPVRLVPRSGH